jgi:A nuclease family of the HNH/ENDO VII superfamily with conserved AHH
LSMPGNAGSQTQRVQLSESLRFEQLPGELGRLLELNASGNWQVVKTGVYLGLLDSQRVALTGDELKALTAPLTNPSDPRPNPPLFTPVPSNDERLGELPGFDAAAPAGPTTTTTPIQWQTWDELIINKQDSEILGVNLRAGGNDKPADGYEAHHIVPSRAGGARMDALRAELKLLEIKLNDAVNGVWLPGPDASRDATEAYHRTLNNKAYNNAVADAFLNVTTKEEAFEVMQRIGSLLQSGNFPGVRPRPKP